MKIKVLTQIITDPAVNPTSIVCKSASCQKIQAKVKYFKSDVKVLILCNIYSYKLLLWTDRVAELTWGYELSSRMDKNKKF